MQELAKSVVDSKAIKAEEREKFLLAMKIKLARELVFRKMPGDKRLVLMRFLKFYVDLSDKNNDLMFDQEIENLKKIKPATLFRLVTLAKILGRTAGMAFIVTWIFRFFFR